MYSYTAAGSNPIPHKAAESALLEALVGIKIHDNINAEFGTTVPTEVIEMEDHVNYYSSDQHKGAYDFLQDSHVTDLSTENYIKAFNTKTYLKKLINKFNFKRNGETRNLYCESYCSRTSSNDFWCTK